MSLHDELRAAQRCVDDLARCVTRLEQRLGRCLDVRRVRGDAERLRESLAMLREARAGGSAAQERPDSEPIRVPDTPYDARLWAGADDEGLGSPR
ncbi:hypothetical protein [Streptomyces sp. 7-21]|jgi:hypothetical protein|uniref:hypothetical protein n=1 Tax=Streptomyces sp. 7-21 TaxID=2802283 RepID=UPI00191EF3DB|nr:hypothetical protein [Streptomyces sp. 7-21]MBL1066261.1 hypothetical protein [Streptomyces sp. 7-21]